MIVLILILGQIAFLAMGLKVIFLLIDKAIITYRRKRFSPNRKRRSMGFDMIFLNRRNRRKPEIFKKYQFNPFTAGLWHQLLVRLQFDVSASERLVNSLKLKHPGKSDQWLIKKAIHDLDRDRWR
ncbi:MAG: hypothetical protein EAZ77_08620 [Nostocales cyanobacterium]|nr:MAG: hypothetical protein EAZ77_08620 [Nostocales cyanobacterium]